MKCKERFSILYFSFVSQAVAVQTFLVDYFFLNCGENILYYILDDSYGRKHVQLTLSCLSCLAVVDVSEPEAVFTI